MHWRQENLSTFSCQFRDTAWGFALISTVVLFSDMTKYNWNDQKLNGKFRNGGFVERVPYIRTFELDALDCSQDVPPLSDYLVFFFEAALELMLMPGAHSVFESSLTMSYPASNLNLSLSVSKPYPLKCS